jgi:hypothetical protein
MRRIMVVLLFVVALLVPLGCTSVPGKSYIEADRKTFTAVAPRLRAYLSARIKPDGTKLDKDDAESAEDTLASWDLRLKEGEKAIAKEGK